MRSNVLERALAPALGPRASKAKCLDFGYPRRGYPSEPAAGHMATVMTRTSSSKHTGTQRISNNLYNLCDENRFRLIPVLVYTVHC